MTAINNQAVKSLICLAANIAYDRKRAAQIREKCQAVAANPPPQGWHANLKPLSGVSGAFRLRFGDWRVSFMVDRATDTMEVFEVKPRGDAYK